MKGIRVGSKRPKVTRWLSMSELGRQMDAAGDVDARDARTALLRAQTRCGKQLMWKLKHSSQGHWYTTLAVVTRHAPELINTEPEALEAMAEFQVKVIDRLENLDEDHRELVTATRSSFRKVFARLQAIEESNKTRQGRTSTRA